MRKRGGNNRGALIVRQLRGTIAEPLPRRAGKRDLRAWKDEDWGLEEGSEGLEDEDWGLERGGWSLGRG